VPLSDRDYMKPPAPRRYNRGPGLLDRLVLDPVMVIIVLNLLVFLLSFLVPDIEYKMGLQPFFFTQRPWTLLTSMFLHVEFFHIFSNMLVLFFFGRIVYKLLGRWRFIAIYLIGGLAGNLLFLWIGPQNSLAFGASGAVYAIAGTLVVLMPTMRVALWGIIPMPLWIFAIIFLGLLSIPPFAGPNIAWQAHMGGLAVGLIAGLIYKRQMRHVIYR
jgi:membrane associated rhomboid family serine protease